MLPVGATTDTHQPNGPKALSAQALVSWRDGGNDDAGDDDDLV